MDEVKIRLFVDHALCDGQTLSLSGGQAQYLYAVMRQRVGDRVKLFNGQDGEWVASIEALNKRSGVLRAEMRLREQIAVPDLWLCFAPIKKARMDMVVEKATELGVSRLLPIETEFANSGRVRTDRMKSQAIEAAEQCGALSVPEVAEPADLATVLQDWPKERALWFCDETLTNGAATRALGDGHAAGILIGPEGGFSDAERAMIRAHPAHVSISLGPRILRAETAAIAALVKWQMAFGDWRYPAD